MTTGSISTRCRAFILTRHDGLSMGFTDHDRSLLFIDPVRGAVTLEPSSAVDASQLSEQVGLTENDMDITGAITSDNITLQDLANGVYDGAEVRFYWLDWSDLTNYDLMTVSRIAEIPRNQDSFTATIEGIGSRASEPQGVRLTRSCRLDFGGPVASSGQGCGLDLAALTQSGVISALISDRSFEVSGLTLPEGWCNFGKIEWTGGDNSGGESTVNTHTIKGGVAVFSLNFAPVHTLALGDGLNAVSGCDKTLSRCKELGNVARRLAFPIPASNVAMKYATDLAGDADE